MTPLSSNRTPEKPIRSWLGIPPWILVGAVLILTPIFIFWAAENIRRQQEMTTLLLLEKGAALIRSFEAGARTGMMGMLGMRGTAFKLQRLLMETVQQPDIVYLIVTDRQGNIRAHSDPDRIGETHGTELDLKRIPSQGEPSWRQVTDPEGRPVFEVFRGFSPRPDPAHFHRRGPRHGMREHGLFSFEIPEDLQTPGIIFVGLDMSTFEAARKEEARHTVVMAVILLLIGFAGLLSVFVVNAYRSTRSSLSRVQAFSDHVVQSLPMGLVALDSERCVISYNRTAVAVLGRSKANALGRQAGEVLPPELTSLIEAASKTARVLEQEVVCSTADGRSVPLSVSVSTLKGPEADFIGLLLLFRDMTEVQTLKQEVERSRRLASVGRLAAGVAHEIRNPLSSIKGFATYFRERYREVDEDRQTADIMIQEVDRLNRVIGQLLDFARPMAVEKAAVRIEPLIRHALKMIEPQAQDRGVQTKVRLDASVNTVPMDADRMGQVLLNLLLNALEATPAGGTLNVSAEADKEAGRIRIEIQDTGKGISREHLPLIFDPYFTTKGSGTGLGLAIVHKIVESHGGEVHVESEEGRGTTVTVELPLDG